MNTNELKNDAARFLVQYAEKGTDLLVHPTGQTELAEETSLQNSKPENANKPVTEDKNPVSVSEGKTGVEVKPSSDRGAPEPLLVVPDQGKIEDFFPSYTDLPSFNEAIINCQKCALGQTRNKLVFGTGDLKADLVFVGEAPGADEDLKGEPFVGRAGKLLDQILGAVDLKRGENVYICNILKCRPPKNRDPLPSEVEVCEPHLVKQLQLLEPKLIVALGRIAAQTLLRTKGTLGSLRGQIHDYHGVPMMVTFHPAALLRNPNWKRPTWEDIQEMKLILDGKASKYQDK
jgi:uracil-DNA glycosylase